MKPIIFDNPEEKGMDLVLDMENGMAITIFLSDETAEEIINIIANKLNGRWKK